MFAAVVPSQGPDFALLLVELHQAPAAQLTTSLSLLTAAHPQGEPAILLV